MEAKQAEIEQEVIHKFTSQVRFWRCGLLTGCPMILALSVFFLLLLALRTGDIGHDFNVFKL